MLFGRGRASRLLPPPACARGLRWLAACTSIPEHFYYAIRGIRIVVVGTLRAHTEVIHLLDLYAVTTCKKEEENSRYRTVANEELSTYRI